MENSAAINSEAIPNTVRHDRSSEIRTQFIVADMILDLLMRARLGPEEQSAALNIAAAAFRESPRRHEVGAFKDSTYAPSRSRDMTGTSDQGG